MKFNPKMVKLRVQEVSYVGHLFSSEGLKPDPDKIRAIYGMPPQEDKFIKHKADIQEPISQLTQKDAAFVWEKPQQEAFDTLKSVITSAPSLAYFDNSNKTVLNVGASSKRLVQ